MTLRAETCQIPAYFSGKQNQDISLRKLAAFSSVENPDQDPGSDYGLQKRGCRDLMAKFAEEQGGVG